MFVLAVFDYKNICLLTSVRELMGWVRNVVLMNVYLVLGNPGGSGFWVGGYMSQVREWGNSRDQRGHQKEEEERSGANAEALVDAHDARVSGGEPGGRVHSL